MNTTEILNAIKEQVAILEGEHTKTSKAARGRARSAANTIKKLADKEDLDFNSLLKKIKTDE